MYQPGPYLFFRIQNYQQWFDAAKLFTPDLLIFPGNNSLQGLAAHFGLIPQKRKSYSA